jgi:hypothetical protein
MKRVILALALIGLVSCKETGKPEAKKETAHLTIDGRTVDIVTIDNCQYLWVYRYKGAALAHKGNCNNPIHKEDERD